MESSSVLYTRRNRQYRLLSLLWIFLVLSGLTFYVVRTHQYTLQLISSSSENEAALLSRSMSSALRRARTVMDWAGTTIGDLSPPRDYAEIETYLNNQTERFSEIHGFVIYGPDTQPVILATGSGSLCAIDYVSYIDDATTDYSYSESMDCPTTGTRIMMVYRLLQDASGRSVGTVATILNLSYYEQLFAQIDVGERGMVSMRRADTSRLVVRWPIRFDRMNNAAPDIPPHELIEAGANAGVVRYVGATDGVDRIFSYDRVEDYPFYVLVGRGYREQFTSWRTISALAVAAALLMVLLTLVLLRRLKRETHDLVSIDADLRRALSDKEALIRELLHRTNNSLQVTRSLVQLELMNADPSGTDTPALTRLDYRVGVLSRAQQLLNRETNYATLPLGTYLETVRHELLRHHPLPSDAEFEIQYPTTELSLDAAAPLGLIVAELCAISAHSEITPPDETHPARISLVVRYDEPELLTVTYSDNRTLTPNPEQIQVITSLAEHQLRGTVSLTTEGGFRCTVTFSPKVYAARIEP